MARDPLQILLALRRRAVEQARQSLAGCLAAEAKAGDRIKSLDEALRREREMDGAPEDWQPFLEMFAIRRHAALIERQSATMAMTAAAARSGEARGEVTAARAAMESVQRLAEQRVAIRDAETSRQEQHALDDVARQGRPVVPRNVSGGEPVGCPGAE